MVKRHRRAFGILALAALCVGILGAGALYRSRGIPAQIEFLFQAVAGLSEQNQEQDRKIRRIVAHIRELKASLCEFHGETPRPSFCGPDGPDSECVPGICDITGEGDPCESANPPPPCDAGGGGGGD